MAWAFLEEVMQSFSTLLEHSYPIACFDPKVSRLEYLADYIFDFTTYDSEMAELFATKALEVCAAITNKTTFEYISDRGNYIWYLAMVNMPFFEDRIEWGTSVRGAWWDHSIEFETCGIWEGDEQRTEVVTFTQPQWEDFMRALIAFAAPVAQAAEAQKPNELTSASPVPAAGDGEGWIEWKGGERPVDAEVRVTAKLRNGDSYTQVAAMWYWSVSGDQDDIVAYKLAQPAGEKP